MKTLTYWKRLFQLFYHYTRKSTVLPYHPLRMWLDLTSYCNLQCFMCPNKDLKKEDKGHMDFNLYKKIIDEASSFVFDVNLNHRGESLLYPDLIKAIQYAKEHNLFARLHTNGTLLDKNLSQAILDSGLDRLSFSFDGYTKENYEKIRIKGNFDKILENIIHFLELKKSQHKKKPVTAIEVIDFDPQETKKNKKRKKDFLNHFKNLPLDEMVIKEFHNWAGEIDTNKTSKIRTSCAFPWNALIIFWNGNVLPCTQDFFGSHVLGNVTDSSLQDIWNNEKMVNLRKKLAEKDVAGLSQCANCDRMRMKNIFGIPKEYIWKLLTKKMP